MEPTLNPLERLTLSELTPTQRAAVPTLTHNERRLLRFLQGGKLALRVFGTLLGAALDTGSKEEEETQKRYGVFADGSPWPENWQHADWEACYGKDSWWNRH
ncbi:MAG: hypothetical protein FWG56_08185 [Desulfovibrionaceae bacterium]|nr:hypothetical protein [Desulfovibrionaceae bacterium]